MKFASVIILAACVLSVVATAQTVVSVFPTSQALTPGTTFAITVRVTDVVNLHLYHVVVQFDNTVMRCESLTSGGFLPGTFFLHLPPEFPSDTARFVVVDDALAGLQTRSGSGAFFVLEFTALQPGTSTVSLNEVVLRDGTNQNIPHTTTGGSITVLPSSMTVNIPVEGQWNLLSLPVGVDDPRTATLFPTASSLAFRYSGVYSPEDSMIVGPGYWLKFPAATAVPISGTAVTVDTIAVTAGWNLVGSISAPVPATSVSAVPPASVLSQFYGYSRSTGYAPRDILQPGFGYWVKVSAAGALILGTGPGSE